jgi:hypothetical protein
VPYSRKTVQILKARGERKPRAFFVGIQRVLIAFYDFISYELWCFPKISASIFAIATEKRISISLRSILAPWLNVGAIGL